MDNRVNCPDYCKTDQKPECEWTVENQGPLGLNNNNKWQQFPGLQTVVHIDEKVNVTVFYNITTASQANTHLCTTLYVDGLENKNFRAISGDTIFHTNTVNSSVILGNGQHCLQVYYRTPGTFQEIGNSDWNCAFLKVLLH